MGIPLRRRLFCRPLFAMGVLAPSLIVCLGALVLPSRAMPRLHLPRITPSMGGTDADVTVVLQELPNFLYVGEELQVDALVRNSSGKTVTVDMLFASGEDGPEYVAELTCRPGDTPITFPLRQNVSRSCSQARLELRSEGETVSSQHFLLVDGRTDLAGVLTDGRRFTDRHGNRVVLVNRREQESEYRKWAALKWVKAQIEDVNAQILFWGNSNAIHPLTQWTQAVYKDNPLQALLSVRAVVPSDKSVTVVLGWGFVECYERMDVREFSRAIDLAIDRIRLHNGGARIVLLTPPPIPGETIASESMAQAIRDVAAKHHLDYVDLHQALMRGDDLSSMYVLDQSLPSLYPGEKGQHAIQQALAKEMR